MCSALFQVLRCNGIPSQVPGGGTEGRPALQPPRGAAGFGRAAHPLPGAAAQRRLEQRLGGQTPTPHPGCLRCQEEQVGSAPLNPQNAVLSE